MKKFIIFILLILLTGCMFIDQDVDIEENGTFTVRTYLCNFDTTIINYQHEELVECEDIEAVKKEQYEKALEMEEKYKECLK